MARAQEQNPTEIEVEVSDGMIEESRDVFEEEAERALGGLKPTENAGEAAAAELDAEVQRHLAELAARQPRTTKEPTELDLRNLNDEEIDRALEPLPKLDIWAGATEAEAAEDLTGWQEKRGVALELGPPVVTLGPEARPPEGTTPEKAEEREDPLLQQAREITRAAGTFPIVRVIKELGLDIAAAQKIRKSLAREGVIDARGQIIALKGQTTGRPTGAKQEAAEVAAAPPEAPAEVIAEKPLPPAPEAAAPGTRPAEQPAQAVELRPDTVAQLPQEARRNYGSLPTREKGWFTVAREKVARLLGRREQDPIQAEAAAKTYFQEQDRLFNAESRGLEGLQRRHGETQTKLQGLEQQLDRMTERENVAVEAALAALAGVKGISPQQIEDKRRQIGDQIRAKEARLRSQIEGLQALVADLGTKIETTGKARKRFEEARKKARQKLDEAVARAVNDNHGNAELARGGMEKCDSKIEEQQGVIRELDRKIAALQEKKQALQTEHAGAEALKIFDELIAEAQGEKRKAEETIKALETAKSRGDAMIGRVEVSNEKLVADLSIEKINKLIQNPGTEWIIPLLSPEKLMELPEKDQRAILGNADYQRALLPKFDIPKNSALLDKLIDDRLVPSREQLRAQGILKKPEAPKAPAAKAETETGGVPETAQADFWQTKLGELGRERGIELRLPTALAGLELTGGEAADLVYDQTVERMERSMAGAKLNETQREGLLKVLAELLRALFGVESRATSVTQKMHTRPESRVKFGAVAKDWNASHPTQKIKPETILAQGSRDLSPAGVKAKLLEQLLQERGGKLTPDDLRSVSEFVAKLEGPAAEQPTVAAAA